MQPQSKAEKPGTKIRPATALPWRARVDARCWWRIGPLRIVPARHGNPADRAQDAAYAAHTANAYPKLVEVLRACIRADNLRAFERGQREPEFQHSADHPARALLRDLGEIE